MKQFRVILEVLILIAILTFCVEKEESIYVCEPGTWMEIPKMNAEDSLSFFTHKAVINGSLTRNYSFCWDSEALVARWVAYPLCKGLIGEGKRTNAWGLDPLITQDCQPVLFSGYKTETTESYDRGHQIPSADRLGRAGNVQTFYSTNMTPQNSRLNSGLWAEIENRVREWSCACDTLYVVSGCVVEGSKKYAFDNDGKKVTVPVAYYKALLRFDRSGRTGKSGYSALALYIANQNPETSHFNREMAVTVDELEDRIGIDLFPSLPDPIQSAVESENPSDNSCWW